MWVIQLDLLNFLETEQVEYIKLDKFFYEYYKVL